MSVAVPPPSRRVLDTLLGDVAHIADTGRGNDATPVERALHDLVDALTEHEAALAKLDRLEDAIVAAHGHRRVPLPADPTGAGLDYAADLTTVDRRVGDASLARDYKGRVVAASHGRAGRCGGSRPTSGPRPRGRHRGALAAAGATLLIAPCWTTRYLRLKRAVLIAAGEPGPDDALVFPWVYLRAIHAHLSITTSNSRSSPTSTPAGWMRDRLTSAQEIAAQTTHRKIEVHNSMQV